MPEESVNSVQPEIVAPIIQTPGEEKFYREPERARICAALKAGASILVIGESGMGKSVLMRKCAEQLRSEGYAVAYAEPATPKQILEGIFEQLELSTTSIEGKKMLVQQMKTELENYLRSNTAFLLLDDGQYFDAKFRGWLKKLVSDYKQTIAVFCTDAPKSDVFLVLPPPLVLRPLPDHLVRDLMERTAAAWNLRLTNRDFSGLIPKASGTPAGAKALVVGEYIGVDNDGTPTERGRDLTPVLLLIALVFVVSRFIGLGTNNPMLYVMAGSIGSVFITFYRLLTQLPKDGKKIRA